MNGSALSISTEAIARAAQFPTVQSMNDIEVVQNIQQLFLEPELAIDSEAMRARGIIYCPSKIQLVGPKYRE